MTDAQILVNNRLHILRNSGTKQAYNIIINVHSSRKGLSTYYITQKWPLLTILTLAKTTPSPYITPPSPSVRYKICGRPQISIAIYRVSRYFFTICIVDEILSIAHH